MLTGGVAPLRTELLLETSKQFSLTALPALLLVSSCAIWSSVRDRFMARDVTDRLGPPGD
jgi:hypothetical protein